MPDYWMRLAPAVAGSRPPMRDGRGDVQARLTVLLGCRWVWWAPDVRAAWGAVLEAFGIDSSHRVHVPVGIADDVRDLMGRSGAAVVDVDLHEGGGTPIWPDFEVRAGRNRDVCILDHRFGLPSRPPHQAGLVLEDVTAAAGGALGGRPVGSLGAATVLALDNHPFSRSKGALLATDDVSCAEKLAATRAISAPEPERAGDLMSDLEALDDWNQGCWAAAGVYNSVWRGLHGVPIRPVLPAPGAVPTYSAYLVRVPEPSALMDELQREGIEARRPLSARIERLIDGPKYAPLTGAHVFYRSVLRLPNHPDLDLHALLHAAGVVRRFLTLKASPRGRA
ncbi:MAG: hypothetical protein ACT4PY_13405 [Armatimonadota bacterium]